MKTGTTIYAVSALILIIGSCSSAPKTTQFQADLSLVRPYTFDLENEKHLTAPYLAKFSKGGKTLLFVASEHLSLKKYPNPLEAPILKTISKIFREDSPQIVVVEGLNTAQEISPQSVIAYSDRCAKSGYGKGCDESIFAIHLARQRTADFVSGEPTEALVLKEALDAGYSAEDLLGFYLVRQIPEMKRQNDFSAASFPERAERTLQNFQKDLGIHLKFGFLEFKDWYSRRMTQPKNFIDVEINDPAPDGGPKATYVQRISHVVSLTRDRAIVKTIERMLNKYDRVMVVYGGSHLMTQEPALKAMLGSPQYEKLF